jgi:hypothetical protein
MRIGDVIGCQRFPCPDVKHDGYCVPNIEVDPRHISIVLISEAAPVNLEDYYYAEGEPLFARTTVQAFNSPFWSLTGQAIRARSRFEGYRIRPVPARQHATRAVPAGRWSSPCAVRSCSCAACVPSSWI